MTASSKNLGAQGEELAARYLSACGYVILERNYRSPGGEIDIIAQDGAATCFIEVKTRRSLAYGQPGEHITREKRRRIIRSAISYLSKRGAAAATRACRFDVVYVIFDGATPGDEPRIELVRNAFTL
ncbi:MAG TPA: YraN family protein [Firmicutes bacterium]|nr:YraN family protein [Bacillota bacterium]